MKQDSNTRAEATIHGCRGHDRALAARLPHVSFEMIVTAMYICHCREAPCLSSKHVREVAASGAMPARKHWSTTLTVLGWALEPRPAAYRLNPHGSGRNRLLYIGREVL